MLVYVAGDRENHGSYIWASSVGPQVMEHGPVVRCRVRERRTFSMIEGSKRGEAPATLSQLSLNFDGKSDDKKAFFLSHLPSSSCFSLLLGSFGGSSGALLSLGVVRCGEKIGALSAAHVSTPRNDTSASPARGFSA
jgi:hypothetical protein